MRWLERHTEWLSKTRTTFTFASLALPKTCTIQQELNCAAMQAPSDPELMEALNSLSETEPIETLRLALDQMRHFLWFYSQVMNNEPELGDKLRQEEPPNSSVEGKSKTENAFLDRLTRADELMLLHHLADSKRRKPN